MKASVRIVATLLVVLVFVVTSSCEFSDAGNIFSGAANGAHLPAEYAIASGDPVLMRESFAAIFAAWESGNLSSRDQAQAALDMIDILAVLSRAMSALVPILFENQDPITFDDAADFFSSADIQYLSEIAVYAFVEDAIINGAFPSPLQHLWSVLGLLSYEIFVNGVDWGDLDTALTLAQQTDIGNWLDAADADALQSGNAEFVAMTAQLRITLGI